MVSIYKITECLRYRRNRFLSYYFLDFSIFERWNLWKNIIKNEVLIPKVNNKTRNYNAKTLKELIVITLSHRQDKQEHIQNIFGKQNLDFTFFMGTEGGKINETDWDYFSHRSIKNLSSGSLGCALSHMKLWERIVLNDRNNLYCIFEDDVILCESFISRITALLSNVPDDVDLFILGSFNTRGRDIKYLVNDKVFKSFNPRRGLYAYFIYPQGAEKLLRLIKPLDLLYGGIDTKIGKLTRQGKINVYHSVPSFVTVDLTFPSDIYNFSLRKKKRLYLK